jgi:hypothetical protein
MFPLLPPFSSILLRKMSSKSTSAAPSSTEKAAAESLFVTAADRANMSESAKWRWTWENAIKLNSVGFLVGTTVGFLLFRNYTVRAGLAAFGGGFGCGAAYVDARYVFGHDVVANRDWIASVRSPSPTPKKDESS